MERYLIIFDIDETLFDNHLGKIPESTYLALNKLKEAGHTLAIATGRAPLELKEEIKQLPMDFFILANGQLVVHKGEIVYENPIATEIVEALMEMAQKNGVHLGFNSSNYTSVTGLDKSLENSFMKYYGAIPEVGNHIEKHDSIYQMWYLDGDLTQIFEDFHDKLTIYPWLSGGADVVAHGSSKAAGLAHAIKAINEILPEKIVFFGDGMNDIEMMKAADIGVAMGNAVTQLKEVATFVTKDIKNDGIYHACVELGLINEIPYSAEISGTKYSSIKTRCENGQATIQDFLTLKEYYVLEQKSPEFILAHLKKALEFYPHEILILNEIAATYEFLIGNDELAKKYYEMVLEIDENHLVAKDAIKNL